MLRNSVGESALAVELELDYKLNERLLPEETDCHSCGSPTESTAYVHVHCESPFQKSAATNADGIAGLTAALGGMMFHAFAHLFTSMLASAHDQDRPREIGKFVAFQLPLRVCPSCWKETRSSHLKKLVLNVPLYRRLIEKYPGASILKIEPKSM